MNIHQLSKYDFPETMIEAWEDQGIEKLQPIQYRAITDYRLFDGKNLIISTPTSSGKTFIGELAAVYNALHKRKSVYLVPTKALAEEKYLSFRKFYEENGIDVVISTRDRREFDKQLSQGKFHIAIIVFEKFFQLLNTDKDFTSKINLVVADELQLLADISRGANLELLLTRLKLINSDFQLIGLSAVLGNSRILPDWLEADLLIEDRRPVELRLGYVSEGVFHYQTFNSRENGEEVFIPDITGGRRDIMVAVAKHLTEQDEQCLIFLPDKDSTRRMAWNLDEETNLLPAENAIRELQELEDTNSRDLLISALQGGVAFHNADLSAEERATIEKYFRAGEIRILASTTTLAMGVNLPARNVILDLDYWRASSGGHRFYKTHMLRSDFENIGGRAGRYKIEKEFGRAITIATTLLEREQFRRIYLEGEIEHIKPQLWEGSMATAVMNAVALGNCDSIPHIINFLRNSLTWKLYSMDHKAMDRLEPELEQGIKDCLQTGVLIEYSDGKIGLSPLGKAATRMGISVNTAGAIARWIEERIEVWNNNPLEILYLASITDDGMDAYLNFSTAAYNSQKFDLKQQMINEVGFAGFSAIQKLEDLHCIDDYVETKCFRNSFVFKDYISNFSNREIEEKYNLYLGSIRNAAEHISWIISAIAEIVDELNFGEERVKQLRNLASRVQYGVGIAGIPLAGLHVPGLGRERIRSLVHQGFDNIEAIKELSLDILAKWTTKPVAARLAKAVFDRRITDYQIDNNEDNLSNESEVNHDRLLIIGKMERNRTLIKLNDHIFGLGEKNFELLLKFAVARLREGDGWIHKLDLGLPEHGITQGISRLRDALGVIRIDQDNSIIENDANSHYRLAIPPQQIELEKETIKKHWSATVQEMIS